MRITKSQIVANLNRRIDNRQEDVLDIAKRRVRELEVEIAELKTRIEKKDVVGIFHAACFVDGGTTRYIENIKREESSIHQALFAIGAIEDINDDDDSLDDQESAGAHFNKN